MIIYNHFVENASLILLKFEDFIFDLRSSLTTGIRDLVILRCFLNKCLIKFPYHFDFNNAVLPTDFFLNCLLSNFSKCTLPLQSCVKIMQRQTSFVLINSLKMSFMLKITDVLIFYLTPDIQVINANRFFFLLRIEYSIVLVLSVLHLLRLKYVDNQKKYITTKY